MRVGTDWAFVRQVFPSSRLCGVGAILFAAAFGLLGFMATRIQAPDVPLFFIKGAALVAGLWWLLMGAQLCTLIYRMVPLRLPRVERTLIYGVLLHGLFSFALPWLVLSFWLPVGVDHVDLAAALWLGSSVGFLIVSMPMAIPLLPLVVIAWEWNVLTDPVSCLLLGCAAWALSVGVWRWQLERGRSSFWAPSGLMLGSSPLQWWPVMRTHPSTSSFSSSKRNSRRRSLPTSVLDVLAACLGPSCQTFKQQFGRAGMWWAYAIFTCTAIGLFISKSYVHTGQSNDLLAVMLVALTSMVMQTPAQRLGRIQKYQRGELANLQLIPGMPKVVDLPRALMHQIVRCLGERLVIAVLLLPAAAALPYTLTWIWLLWWCVFSVVAMVQGLASAWLAWHGLGRNLWWVGSLVLGLLLAIINNVHLITSDGPIKTIWLMAWALWLAVSIMLFAFLNRKVSR